MKKRILTLASVLMLTSISMVQAQTAYTYVQQNGSVVAADGTAAFSLDSYPTVAFDADGKAVMKIDNNIVAALPMTEGGELVVEFDNNSGNTEGTKSVTVGDAGYGTFYSPFQLTVPTGCDVKVYAPTYNATSHIIDCNSKTEIASGSIIPAGTGLVLKNAGTIDFGFSEAASTDTHTSALCGSALAISVPTVETGNIVYTLGHNAANDFGFFKFNGTTLNAGKAYLVAGSLNTSTAKFVAFNFNDNATTSINSVNTDDNRRTMKYVENRRVVIVKNGQKYNVNGQEVK